MAEKEDELLKKRISELAMNCYRRDIPQNTDFMTLYEQTIFHTVSQSLPRVKTILTGGYEEAERKIVCFLPSYEEETAVLPIRMIKAGPEKPRFAEELTHRDYLGAIMNLGIERGCIGDILMDGTGCFIFCLEKMADYMVKNLTMVRHTPVVCRLMEDKEVLFSPKYEEIGGSVASPRIDAVAALVFHLSRSRLLPYIEGEKVFADGRLITSAGFHLKGGEIISVRGLGKFCYLGIDNETKKGRLYVRAKKYQ